MLPSIFVRPSHRVALIWVLCCLSLLFLLHTFHSQASLWVFRDPDLALRHTTYNRTLGFGRVFAIGFADRMDKHDALTLASSYSDIDLTWSEGVRYEDIPEKALPALMVEGGKSEGAIGCWRAHMNVMSTIVNERLETALVLEDDNDWDVTIKSQLYLAAQGFTALQTEPALPSPRSSPYGNNWDLLWLGHCHSGPPDDIESIYVLRNDSTVPPLPHRGSWWLNKHLIPEVISNDTRVLYPAADGRCMWGVALTLEAARKVLAMSSLQGGDGRQIDTTLSNLCESGYLNCYSIFPPLFSSHRFAGSEWRDSEIVDKSRNGTHEEYTKGIVYSTTINVWRMANGATNASSQWPEETVPFRAFDESLVGQVSGSLQAVDLRSLPEYEIPAINVKGQYDPKYVQELRLT